MLCHFGIKSRLGWQRATTVCITHSWVKFKGRALVCTAQLPATHATLKFQIGCTVSSRYCVSCPHFSRNHLCFLYNIQNMLLYSEKAQDGIDERTYFVSLWNCKSSVECNKVVSAFLSFCGKSNFVFRFPLYFIIFWHLVLSIKKVNTLSWYLYHDSKCVILHVLFYIYNKLDFTQNVTYDLLAFTRQNVTKPLPP